HLPPRAELLAFAERARAQALEVLAAAAPDHPDALPRDGFIGEMVYEHECQHQEIMTFLLQMIPPERKRRPDDWRPAWPGDEPGDAMATVPGGPFVMGTAGGGFAYDNERPSHGVSLAAYRIDRAPVT